MYGIDEPTTEGGVMNIKFGYKTTNLSIWGGGEEGYTKQTVSPTHIKCLYLRFI